MKIIDCLLELLDYGKANCYLFGLALHFTFVQKLPFTKTDLGSSITWDDLNSGWIATFTAALLFNLCNVVGVIASGIVRNRVRCVSGCGRERTRCPACVVQTGYEIKLIPCAIIEIVRWMKL
uniref:Uncharacterized protein n=1 Tax=Glossina austeni TaxID=7395 RepID=A0A1A9UG95_GLOAU